MKNLLHFGNSEWGRFAHQNKEIKGILNTEVDQNKDWSEEMKNAKIWTTEAQNKLAQEVKNKQGTLREVAEGDTTGAVFKGLFGSEKVDYSMPVEYRSSKLPEDQKPKVLSETNRIYPGQYIWIEDGKVIVADKKIETSETDDDCETKPPIKKEQPTNEETVVEEPSGEETVLTLEQNGDAPQNNNANNETIVIQNDDQKNENQETVISQDAQTENSTETTVVQKETKEETVNNQKKEETTEVNQETNEEVQVNQDETNEIEVDQNNIEQTTNNDKISDETNIEEETVEKEEKKEKEISPIKVLEQKVEKEFDEMKNLEFNPTYEDVYTENLLKYIDEQNLDFNGVFGSETASRKIFVRTILKHAEKRNIAPPNQPDELGEFFSTIADGRNIDYGFGGNNDKNNEKVLENADTWMDKKVSLLNQKKEAFQKLEQELTELRKNMPQEKQ